MLKPFGIFSIGIVLLLSGCSVERNLARQYIKKHAGHGIMIVPQYELFKDNLTISFDPDIQYTSFELDSIAWVQSSYIKHISDSIFLSAFSNSLIEELTSQGYDLYLDASSDVFFSLPDPKWMIQIAQLQLNEEHLIVYHRMYSVEDGEPYDEPYNYNQVSLCTWFEVSRANTANKQVLYLEGYVEDDLNLNIDFDFSEGTIGLLGDRDSLELDNIYTFAGQFGEKHGEMLFDYFMNDYIRENLPPGIIDRQYFHYNRRTKSLKRGLPERFDVVN
jgi:hypothetical protein